jgi:hypothetical protein
MSTPPLLESPWSIAVLAVIGFAVMWAAISSLIAAMSGWRHLAQSYRLTSSFNGRQWCFRSGRMRWSTNYNGCLTIGADVRGLYLAVLLLFRIGHPPLFIPWSDVQLTMGESRFFSSVEFNFRRAPGVVLRIHQPLGKDVLAAAGRSLPEAKV